MERVRRISLADPPHEPAHESRGSQRSLVRASRRGDIDAFTRLFERYRVPLYQACLHRLRNGALAEDAVQETFLKAYENFSRFDPGRRIWPWLVTIADHTCIDLFRRQAKLAPIDETDDLEADPETGSPHPPGPVRHAPDDTFDAIVGAERRAQLEQLLGVLPPRQRRALMLFAVEGWTYPEIASAEGISHVAIKSVIWRARATLRKVAEVGALNVLVFPYRALRQRLARARAAMDQIRAEGLYAGSLSSVGAGVLALTLALGGGMPGTIVPVSNGATVESPSTVAALLSPSLDNPSADHAAAPHEDPRAPHASVPTGRNEETALEDLQDSADRANRLAFPAEQATPENTSFTSIVPSPNYQRDHVIFAAGTVPCVHATCRVIFRSEDGGASWIRLKSQGLTGHVLLLPPTYPEDARIFAIGTGGVQESTDGGNRFDTVSPLGGGGAISPAFGTGDKRILIGGPTITEYLTESGATKPSSLPVMSVGFSSIAFSPAYRPDGTVDALGRGVILVGASSPSSSNPPGTIYQPTVHRCEGSVCTSTRIPAGPATPSVRISPSFARDGVAYAFTPHALFASADGGRNFRALPIPAESVGLTDVVLPPAGATVPSGSVFATVSLVEGSTPGGVYRSADGGNSWTRLPLDLSGFDRGTQTIAVTPTGRVLVASRTRGIACSADAGMTWSAQCTSEPLT